MRRGRFTAELTDEDGSRVKVTVDGKSLEVSLGRFLSVLRDLGAARGPDPPVGKVSELEQVYIPSGVDSEQLERLLGAAVSVEQRAPSVWPTEEDTPEVAHRTKMGNVVVLMRSLPRGWFTSHDVKRFYEERFGVRMTLSTTSMYLGRLCTRGRLSRVKAGRFFKYKLVEEH